MSDSEVIKVTPQEENVKSVDIADNEEAVNEDANEANKEIKKAINDPDHPLTEDSIKNIHRTLEELYTLVQITEDNWLTTAREFKIKDSHMRQLAVYNEQHATKMPEDISEEERSKWDYLNGLDHITRAEAAAIFGENSPILGVDDSQTRDRVKEAGSDFMSWLIATREYKNTDDAFMKLNELEEEKAITELAERAKNEKDPEKKEKLERSIHDYFRWKNLEFLADPLSDKDKKLIIKAFTNSDTCEYWITRTREKLDTQLMASGKFILEIANFEKRFLEEKYWKCSNIILLYFAKLVTFHDMVAKEGTSKDQYVTSQEYLIQARCMIYGLDSIIRKQCTDEQKEKMLNSIRALEDQFIDIVPEESILSTDKQVAEPVETVQDVSEDNGSLADNNK